MVPTSLRCLFVVTGMTAVTFAQSAPPVTVTELLKELRAKCVPDRRTAVFDVQGELAGSTLTLRGDVYDASVKEKLLQLIKERGKFTVVDSLTTLPDRTVGAKGLSVANTSVVHLRRKPGHEQELVTQALLGTPLKVLKLGDEDGDGWLLVQTPDDYIGWVRASVPRWTAGEFEVWSRRPKVIITTTAGCSYRTEDPAGPVTSDIVAGNILALIAEAKSSFEVEYPDGRKAFVLKTQAERLDAWLAAARDTPENIIATARRFTGTPYLWGGTSTKCMDCSGFSRTAYFLNGVLLPRDAGQQALIGEDVDTTQDFRSVRPGDLLFFGGKANEKHPERVTHVAISLGGARFIHSSVNPGYITENSFDPKDPDFRPDLRKSLLRAKRVIGAGKATGVRRLEELPYYRGSDH